MEPQIKARSLTIRFPIYDRVSRTVRAQLVKGNNEGQVLRHVTALDSVDLDIFSGERVGILGKNGAGKSTILRTFAGVFTPKSGELDVRGSIASLFEIGVGLDPDASGFDNVPLLMASYGIPLSRKDEMIDQVIEFAELGEAMQRPLRTYSAGMRLRIAFAIATAKNADVLLMDEVIGVGDKDFRDKSKLRMETLMEKSGTLVLASHSNAYLLNYCKRGIVLRGGKIIFDGPIQDAIDFHSGN